MKVILSGITIWNLGLLNYIHSHSFQFRKFSLQKQCRKPIHMKYSHVQSTPSCACCSPTHSHGYPMTHTYLECFHEPIALFWYGERDVAQSIACPPLNRSVVGSILLSGPSCSLGYFPLTNTVVHNWFIKGCGMYCSVYGQVISQIPCCLLEPE